MPEWKCEKCGCVHDSNPGHCEECEHTILVQYRNPSKKTSVENVAYDGEGETYSHETGGHWLWIIPGILIHFWKYWLALGLLILAVWFSGRQGWIALLL